MKINIKTGVALTLMSAPVFFVLFLHLFGENHFQMSRMYCNTDSCYTVHTPVIPLNGNIKIVFVGEETKANDLPLSRIKSVTRNEKVTLLCLDEDSVSAQTYAIRSSLRMSTDSLQNKDLALLDWNAHICGYYTLQDPLEVEQLRNEIGVLLQELKQENK